jgi:DNA mismatch endonuclease, patch repair protein
LIVIDVVDKITRSRMMAGIQGRNTSPEVRLRKALHRIGWRYRLHVSKLPGRPDIVLASRKIVIFVNGCFWHRHEGCHWCTTPASNAAFWDAKFSGNIERDKRNQSIIENLGWRVAVVWECGLRSPYFDTTLSNVIRWATAETGNFESPLVRPKTDLLNVVTR